MNSKQGRHLSSLPLSNPLAIFSSVTLISDFYTHHSSSFSLIVTNFSMRQMFKSSFTSFLGKLLPLKIATTSSLLANGEAA